MTEDRPTFVYLLRPRRPDFLATMTPDEDRIMGEHFRYLKGKLEEGDLVMAGPCTDAAFGIVVLHAADAEAAERAMRADPAIAGGIMSAELHGFRIALHAAAR